MEIKYVKELGNNYMIIEAGMSRNEYAYRIVTENQIEGLLQVSRSNVNGKTDYYYEINGKTSIDRFYSKKAIEYDDLKNLMMAIARLPESLDEYLLDKSYVLLGLETVFVDGKGNVLFTLFPDEKSDFCTGIKEIAAFVLSKINHQDAKCVTAAYQVFEVAGRENFGMEEISGVFGCEGEVADKGFEDEILAFNEEEYDIVMDDDDIFEGEGFEDEDYEKLKRLPDFDNKEEIRTKIKNKAIDLLPILVIIMAGVFLFIAPAASAMSLGIKIVCFFMVCAAMVLVRLLLKGRFNSEK